MRGYQNGAALIVGLVLLLALTIIGVIGMQMARSQLLMAGNDQFYAQAVNAAEAAVNAQIANNQFNAALTVPDLHTTPVLPGVQATATSTLIYINQGTAPDGGFSDDVLTHRFRLDAVGQAPVAPVRARASISQGLYVLAPGE